MTPVWVARTERRQPRTIQVAPNGVFLRSGIEKRSTTPNPSLLRYALQSRKCQQFVLCSFCRDSLRLISASSEFLYKAKSQQLGVIRGSEVAHGVSDIEGYFLVPRLLGCAPRRPTRRSVFLDTYYIFEWWMCTHTLALQTPSLHL